jgi:Tfp pilus assembly PilM family ATPase
MLFSAKKKGFFVELSDHGCLFARTSSDEAPLVVEALEECRTTDPIAIAEVIKKLQPKKTPTGYLHANASFYPAKRMIRRAAVDLKRIKDPGYLNEVIAQQFRIEPEKYAIAVLQSTDGADYEVAKATQKEALFCGVPAEDILNTQNALLASGIYPERVELASVSVLGAIVDYVTFKRSKAPTLVLEIGDEATHTYIVSTAGVEAARPIPQGLTSMIPVVQKELNLKDEESAKRLFYSNTFDFAGMGPLLIKKLLKELQSSIGFYEVQTGQSIGQVLCTQMPGKLTWLDATIANALGVPSLKLDLAPWLQSRQITVSDQAVATGLGPRWFGLLGLITQYSNLNLDAFAAEKKD